MLKTKAGEIIGSGAAPYTEHGDARHIPPKEVETFLRIRDVVARTGLGAATIYEWQSNGSFPQSVKLGPKIVAWLESEVSEWMRARVAEREDA